ACPDEARHSDSPAWLRAGLHTDLHLAPTLFQSLGGMHCYLAEDLKQRLLVFRGELCLRLHWLPCNVEQLGAHGSRYAHVQLAVRSSTDRDREVYIGFPFSLRHWLQRKFGRKRVSELLHDLAEAQRPSLHELQDVLSIIAGRVNRCVSHGPFPVLDPCFLS